jgi:hypothetical protein
MAGSSGWTYRDAGGLAKATVVLLYADAALSAISAAWAVALGPENFWGPGVDLFQLLRGVATLVTSVCFLIWLYRANANVRALGADDMMGSPGLGVAWFFIPLANLFMPYMTVRDVWRASARPRDWQGESAAATILLWWIAWLAAGIMGIIVFQMELANGFKPTSEAGQLSLIADLSFVAAALLLVAIIRGVQERQSAAWPASVY